MPVVLMAIAIGAGALSAILFASLLTGSLGAFVLAYLAPLPLLAIGLSLGPGGAVIAGATASIVLALVGGVVFAVVFALANAGPVMFVARQAALNRIDGQGGVEWYPVGTILAWLGGMAACAVAAIGVLIASGPDGFEGYANGVIAPTIAQLGATGLSADQLKTAAHAVAQVFPGLVALSWLLMLAINGALAQGLLARFKLNRRPTPDLARLELPDWIPGATVIAAIGALMPGLAGFFGANLLLVAASVCAFLGLAVVHHYVRGWNHSALWLTVMYIFLFVFTWPALLLCLLGMAEPWLKLRSRNAGPTAS
jgi:hypothetical protein